MPINLKQGDNAVTEDKVDIAWGTSGALSPTEYSSRDPQYTVYYSILQYTQYTVHYSIHSTLQYTVYYSIHSTQYTTVYTVHSTLQYTQYTTVHSILQYTVHSILQYTEYIQYLSDNIYNHLSLSTIVLNSRDWYEVIWLLENSVL